MPLGQPVNATRKFQHIDQSFAAALSTSPHFGALLDTRHSVQCDGELHPRLDS
jgi:hypothetical protein